MMRREGLGDDILAHVELFGIYTVAPYCCPSWNMIFSNAPPHVYACHPVRGGFV